MVKDLKQSLHEMLKQVQHDRNGHVTLNLVQGLTQVLLEMLKQVQHDKNGHVTLNLRIFGRVERSGTRKVAGNVEFSDTPNNPRQFQGLTSMALYLHLCKILNSVKIVKNNKPIFYAFRMTGFSHVTLNKPSGGYKAKPYPFIARRFQGLKQNLTKNHVVLNLFQDLKQDLTEIPKRVRNDRKNARWTVTLNSVQGLKQSLHEMLKPVQGDMAKYLKTFQQNIFCTFNLARILIYG